MNFKCILKVFTTAVIVTIAAVVFVALVGGLLFLLAYFLGDIAAVLITFFIFVFAGIYFQFKKDYNE